MLLENKNAVIYGAGGAIGDVAAREGASALLAYLSHPRSMTNEGEPRP